MRSWSYEAAREAYAKSYTHLYVIGFAIQPTARDLIEECAEVVGVPATYVQATPDLLMGDLLKNMRSSQISASAGCRRSRSASAWPAGQYEVELLGLDVFDPVTMDDDTRGGGDVPGWLLDTDYNDLASTSARRFSPDGAWDNLKRALRGEYDESVWAAPGRRPARPSSPARTARSP